MRSKQHNAPKVLGRKRRLRITDDLGITVLGNMVRVVDRASGIVLSKSDTGTLDAAKVKLKRGRRGSIEFEPSRGYWRRARDFNLELKDVDRTQEAVTVRSESVARREDHAKVAEQGTPHVKSSEEAQMTDAERPQSIRSIGIKGFDPDIINDPDFRERLRKQLEISKRRLLETLDPNSVEAGILRGDVVRQKIPKPII
jgi:hypothetical protein